jgi:hypothetical protein
MRPRRPTDSDGPRIAFQMARSHLLFHSSSVERRTRIRLPRRMTASGVRPRTRPATMLQTCAFELRRSMATSASVRTVLGGLAPPVSSSAMGDEFASIRRSKWFTEHLQSRWRPMVAIAIRALGRPWDVNLRYFNSFHLLRRAPHHGVVQWRSCVVSRWNQTDLRIDPIIARMLKYLDEGWRGHLVSVLDAGIKEGVFRPDLDTRATSELMMSQLRGLGFQGKFDASRLDETVTNLALQTELWVLARPGNTRKSGKR